MTRGNRISATRANQPSDATLVAAAVAGDRHAFAGIYDRYSDRMHDFCWSLLRNSDEAADAMQDTFMIAADRLHQLRDPDRLRPWLYAVARSVALSRLRHLRRERVEAELDDTPDTAAGPHEVAHHAELRDLVWEAARGLSDRDRVVLDLHLRHGLEGRELATALEVSENNANVTLSRVRDRVERSLGAFLIARLGSEHCVELQHLLRNWDGRFTPLVRKRVARHVDDCDVCDARRRAVASPWALLGTVPLVPAPAALRAKVLGDIELTSAKRRSSRNRGAAARVASVLVLALVAVGGLVAGANAVRSRTPSDATTVAPDAVAPIATMAPGSADLEVSPAVLELEVGDAGILTVRNVGAVPTVWSMTTDFSYIGLEPAGGALDTGQLVRVRIATRSPPTTPATATIVVAFGAERVMATVEVRAAKQSTPVDTAPPLRPRPPGVVSTETTTPGRDPVEPTTPARDDPRPSSAPVDPQRPINPERPVDPEQPVDPQRPIDPDNDGVPGTNDPGQLPAA